MPTNPDYSMCYLFVDGGYVRESRRQHGVVEWFNPNGPKSYLESGPQVLNRHIRLVRCFYYDANDQNDQSMQKFIQRVKQLDNTFVRLGELTGAGKNRRQKGVDILLTVDALKHAQSGHVDVIALVTGDADFVPLVEAIRDAGPIVYVMAFKGRVACSLLEAADKKHVFDEVPNWPLK